MADRRADRLSAALFPKKAYRNDVWFRERCNGKQMPDMKATAACLFCVVLFCVDRRSIMTSKNSFMNASLIWAAQI